MTDPINLPSDSVEQLLRKQSDRAKRVARWLSVLAVFTGGLGLVGAVTNVVSDRVDFDLLGEKAVVQSRSDLDNRVVRILGRLQSDVATLQRAQIAISKSPNGDKTAIQLATLNEKIDAITARQLRLEMAIESNPEKALSLPLLKRDLDNMKESNAQNVAAVKASVDQVYDLTKWLLGTLALGVISLAFSNFFQRKSDE